MKRVTCVACGKVFSVNYVSKKPICHECKTKVIQWMEWLRVNNIKKLTHCFICGQKIPSTRQTVYTCGSKDCSFLFRSYQNHLRTARKEGRTIIPEEPPKAVGLALRQLYIPTLKDRKMARFLGLTLEQYVDRKPKALPIDDCALRARVLGISYGEYMARRGLYGRISNMETEKMVADEGDTKKVHRVQRR